MRLHFVDRLAPEDEYLLEDEVSAPTDAKRSRHHNKNVSWLRKTEYISTELTNKFKKAEKAESRIGFNMRRMLKEEQHLYRDRQSQIDAIEATFEAARKPVSNFFFQDFEMNGVANDCVTYRL